MICNSILDALGHTPIIRLSRMCGEDSAEVLVKFEGLNVGGSIKTRTAYNMILDAEKKGLIHKDTIIVEPTSGNQGIGLALVGAVRRYKVKIIMPDSVSEERVKLIKLYGASVVKIKDYGNIGDAIKRCEQYANELKSQSASVFITNQFANPVNAITHEEQTAREIIADLNGNIDGLCVGVGSGGTITGIGRAIKRLNPLSQIWAVEPRNAKILFEKGKITSHIQMGIGDGVIPPILDRGLISAVVTVSDDEAVRMAKGLALKEGLACGISSGSNLCGAVALTKKLGAGKRVVTILPDGAERYFSTALFE